MDELEPFLFEHAAKFKEELALFSKLGLSVRGFDDHVMYIEQ